MAELVKKAGEIYEQIKDLPVGTPATVEMTVFEWNQGVPGAMLNLYMYESGLLASGEKSYDFFDYNLVAGQDLNVLNSREVTVRVEMKRLRV